VSDEAAQHSAQATASSGGVTRMSDRVMNLAHLLTQNGRRHGDRIGLIWGDRSGIGARSIARFPRWRPR